MVISIPVPSKKDTTFSINIFSTVSNESPVEIPNSSESLPVYLTQASAVISTHPLKQASGGQVEQDIFIIYL